MSSFDRHPAALFYKHRLPFSLSCDNLLLSGNHELRPSPSNEVLHLARDVIPNNQLLEAKVCGKEVEVYVINFVAKRLSPKISTDTVCSKYS